MDLLQIYSHLSLLIVAASLLAILGLRISTGSTEAQVELIQEFRTSLEQTSRNCMRARSAALAREFEAHDDRAFGRCASVVRLASKQLVGRHYVEESERLIRALASITRDNDDTRVSQLRRRLKELKRVQLESVRLLSALGEVRKKSAIDRPALSPTQGTEVPNSPVIPAYVVRASDGLPRVHWCAMVNPLAMAHVVLACPD